MNKRLNQVIDSLLKQQVDLKDVVVVGLDINGNYRHYSSFSNKADEVYALKALEFTLMFEDFNKPEDKELN